MINVLSFRLSSWYSSGVFVLIMVILISVLAVGVEGVSPLIITLFSSIITLPVSGSSKGGYNGLLIALNIKPGVCSLDNYNSDTYGFSF